jgi:uncharacterized OsmC-like protein
MFQYASVPAGQARLHSVYEVAPHSARIASRAGTVDRDPSDPFRATVFVGAGDADLIPFAADRALGGPDGVPSPGDLLCAALAASQDSSIRLAANALGIRIEALSVEARGWGDLRGAPENSPDTPVGYRAMQCTIRIRVAAGTDPECVRRMLIDAERSCIVLATLRRSVSIYTRAEQPAAGPVALAA